MTAERYQRPYRAPYDWDALLAFLSSRAIGGVEAIADARYRRALRSTRECGWIDVGVLPHEASLDVELSPSLASDATEVLRRIDHAMDVDAEPAQIARVLRAIARNPGLRVPGAFDGFEIAVRAIVGQQISVKAARTLASRFAETFGSAIETPFPGVVRLFPRAADVAGTDPERIRALGIIGARAATILALAERLAGGSLRLEPGADVASTVHALRSIRGIGGWTAQYIAMRALDDADAFPHTDLGVSRALGERDPRRILALGEAWRPWRAYAVMHLWHAD